MCDVLIATGEVFHEATDLDLPGVPPFVVKRVYSSTWVDTDSLGQGWRHNWDVELVVQDDAFVIHNGFDGPTRYTVGDCDGIKGPIVSVDAEKGIAELRYPDHSRRTFVRNHDTANRWRLQQQVDSYGNWVRLRYANGLLVGMTDAERREIAFQYQRGWLAGLEVQIGSQVLRLSYRHDDLGRLIEFVDELGFSERFEYADHRMTRQIDRNGVSRFFCYDGAGRCVLNWYQHGLKVRQLQWLPHRHLALLTDSYGYRDLYHFSETNDPLLRTDCLGRENQWLYSDDGGLLCEILPDGLPLSTTLLDVDNGVSMVTDARGANTTFHTDQYGRVTAMENAAGHTLKFEYNPQGNLIELLGPDGAHWRFEYDERGRLAKLIDPKGYWIARSEANRQVRVWDELGVLGLFDFDALGNMLADTDAQNRVTRYEYEGQDRLTRLTMPDGRQLRWQYDPVGRIIAVIDGLGRATRFAYSPFGTVVRKDYPDGRVVRLEVDREEHITQIINSKGETTRLEYDPAFRVQSIVFFDGRTDRHDFDLRNRVTVYTDGRGDQTRFEYDEERNPVRVEFPDASVLTCTYDELERLVALELSPQPGSDEPPQEMKLAYSGNDFVVLEHHDGYEVAYQHDACGHLTEIKDSIGRRIRYDIGPRGSVQRMDDNGRVFVFQYAPTGEITRIQLPGGMRQEFQFDDCSRLVRREVFTPDGRLVAWRDYQYDAADQLVRRNDWQRGALSYRYDLGGRLVEVIGPDGRVVERYTYDSEGNLLSSPDFAAYAYDPGNRLKQSDSVQYQHDGAGCLVQRIEKDHRWDFVYGRMNQLRRVLYDGKEVAAYAYDLSGRRTRKTTPDQDVHFYHHVNLLRTLESSRDGRWDFCYVPGTYVPLAQIHDGEALYFSYDQIGTPTEVWDEDGNLLATLNARAFGSGRTIQRAGTKPATIPFHFLGQFVDEESGLHYNRFRYYWPPAARYLCHDPIGLIAGLNLYIYPTNPLNWVDPLGLQAVSILLNCWPSSGPPFTACEQKALMEKVGMMNQQLSQRPSKKRCTSCRKNKQADYFKNKCGGSVPKGFHVDHVTELQVGGADKCCKNLMAIPGRPNTSSGSQIRAFLDQNPNAIVSGIGFMPPGCQQASQCQGTSSVRGSDSTSCEEPDPISC